MPSAKVLFIVPESLDGLVAALEEAMASLDGDVGSERDEGCLRAYLADRIGGPVEASTEDEDDPIDFAWTIMRALDEAGADYVAVTDAFTEVSRGLRCEGRVYSRVDGDREELAFPWVEGDPSIDRRSFVTAGMAVGRVEAVLERLMPPASTPRPA